MKSFREFADAMGVLDSTVRQWHKTGKIKFEKNEFGLYVVGDEVLEHWLKNYKRKRYNNI